MVKNYFQILTAYKAWANKVTLDAIAGLSKEELERKRDIPFGSILQLLHHSYSIDLIFQAHIQGREHGLNARITSQVLDLPRLAQLQFEMDEWYCKLVEDRSSNAMACPVEFTFIGGGDGLMSVGSIILHIVNHATFHRGFIASVCADASLRLPATDLTIYIRDNSFFRAAIKKN